VVLWTELHFQLLFISDYPCFCIITGVHPWSSVITHDMRWSSASIHYNSWCIVIWTKGKYVLLHWHWFPCVVTCYHACLSNHHGHLWSLDITWCHFSQLPVIVAFTPLSMGPQWVNVCGHVVIQSVHFILQVENYKLLYSDVPALGIICRWIHWSHIGPPLLYWWWSYAARECMTRWCLGFRTIS